jgi:ADP-heptose:LPS heptosyltransferase
MSAGMPKEWLAVRLSALGDVVLTTGVLDFWQRTRGFRFRVLTRAANAPVFEGHPAVDGVVGLTDGDLSGAAWGATVRRLAREHAGLGLMDLHGTLRSRLLGGLWPMLAGGPVRRYPKFGLERRLLGLLPASWRDAVAERRLLALNVPQRYALAVEPSAPDRALLRPRVWLTSRETDEAAGLLFSLGLDPSRPPVALHPFATHELKAWPGDHWLDLVALLDRAGRDWVVVGRSERPLFPGHPRDLTNRTGLRATCGLLAGCTALVTGDSGPMHLATAVGTPVLALFGPTSAAWGFTPSGPRDRVMELELPCRPCSLHGKSGCDRDKECLRRIWPDQVAAALDSL